MFTLKYLDSATSSSICVGSIRIDRYVFQDSYNVIATSTKMLKMYGSIFFMTWEESEYHNPSSIEHITYFESEVRSGVLQSRVQQANNLQNF